MEPKIAKKIIMTFALAFEVYFVTLIKKGTPFNKQNESFDVNSRNSSKGN